MNNIEQWKAVSWATDYFVSNMGRVKSLKNNKEKIMKPSQNQAGYQQVNLRIADGYKPKSVHRLVLETFVGPCPEGMECCHNNGKAWDNRLENLRWDTAKNNQADKKLHGTDNSGERNPLAKFTNEQVAFIKAKILEGMTHEALASIFSTDVNTILSIHSGRLWSSVAWPENTAPVAIKADVSTVGRVSSASSYYGEKNPNSKVNEETVLNIRRDLAAGLKNKQIQEKYGVSRYIVYGVQTGQTWAASAWPEGVTVETLNKGIKPRFRDSEAVESILKAQEEREAPPMGRERKQKDSYDTVEYKTKSRNRFETYFTKGEGCWDWTGYVNHKGLGTFVYAGRAQSAPRVAYLLYVGEVPSGMRVVHTCGNAKCVSPAHLKCVTPEEHTKSMVATGAIKSGDASWSKNNLDKIARGASHSQTVFTDDDVAEVKSAYEAGLTNYNELAKKFGVNRKTISNIVNGRTWK